MGKPEKVKATGKAGEVLPPIAPVETAPSKNHVSKRSAKNVLSGLTEKQEAFVNAVMKGHNQTEAYRIAYDTQNMSDATVYRCAWDQMRHPKIRAKLEEYQALYAEKQSMYAVGLAGFVQEKLLHIATDPGSPKHVQVKALETLGRSVGMFVDRKETKTISDDSLPELEAKLKAKMDALKLAGGS